MTDDGRDERMDGRLRDYASRWTAARPAPGGVTVPEERRGRSWVPLAAAASVVALVAGVAFAVGPARERGPAVTASTSRPASMSSSPLPKPTYAPCRQGQVLGDVILQPQGPSEVIGTMHLLAQGESCTLPRAPKVEILGDGGEGVGVEFVFEGPDPQVVLSGHQFRMSLAWAGPFCPGDTKTLTARVTLIPGVTFVHPLVRTVVPACGDTITRASVLRGRWDAWQCDETAYEVLSTSATTAPGGPAGSGVVTFEVILRNVSQHHCEVNLKPFVRIRTEGGKDLRLGGISHSDARNEPALAPGERARASVAWYLYCGETDPGAYTLTLLAGQATVPFTVTQHPVPGCTVDSEQDLDGSTSATWLQPLDRGTSAPRR